jgi:hypothetical protein
MEIQFSEEEFVLMEQVEKEAVINFTERLSLKPTSPVRLY